jgi:hypothetical protein
MNPAERMRAVSRHAADEHVLAVEAADALAGFAADPAGLVVACRRLLAHHPASGPLWWVCARVLAAADPRASCAEAAHLLDADRTAERLAATLPLVDDPAVVAVLGWPDAVDRAVAERGDLPVVALRTEAVQPAAALRGRRTDRTIRVLDAFELAGREVARLLVPALAIGPGLALVPGGSAEVLSEGAAASELWLVGGVGRVLPARLFDAARRAVDADPSVGGAVEVVALERFDRAVGPRGLERVDELAARPDCPVVPELLRAL